MFLVSNQASATQPGGQNQSESSDKAPKLPWAFTGSSEFEKLRMLQICMDNKESLSKVVYSELKTAVKDKTPDEAKAIISAYLKDHSFKGTAHIVRCENEKKEYVAALKKIGFDTIHFESSFNNSVNISANYYKAIAVVMLEYLVNNTKADLGLVNFDKMCAQLLELADNPEKAADYEFSEAGMKYLHSTALDSKNPGPAANLYYPVAQLMLAAARAFVNAKPNIGQATVIAQPDTYIKAKL